jgi:cytochrome c oxidase assembly protein subunit 15
MENNFKFLTRLSLVLVYLVILAGATVRMTGSGMGCPDWPKCFGYYIPPIEQSQVLFQPNSKYKKGEMIIFNEEKLLVAKSNFNSSDLIDLKNWDTYEKHDYIIFNPVHTWIEYVNRLIGAISGIPILLFTIISVVYFKKYKHLTFISFLTLLCMGFQAWLGKTVVDSNLAPFKITFHMLMALLIIALLIYLVNSSSNYTIKKNKIFTNFLFVAIILTLVQIVLGTQVRQFVDEQANVYYDKFQWFNEIPKVYEYHRTFSLVVIAVNFGLFYLNKKLNLGNNYISYVIVLLFIEALSGVVMFYFDFPFGSQTIHLFIASLIFGFQFFILLQNITFKNKLNYDI